jgi:integrase/recombinase XerD
VNVGDRRLRAVAVSAAEASPLEGLDGEAVQDRWLEDYLESMRSRGFSATTVQAVVDTLPRTLEGLPCFVWEVVPETVDGLLIELSQRGVGATTRRKYVDGLMRFHRFVRLRKGHMVEQLFGVRMEEPTDEFNVSHHVASDAATQRPPPRADELEVFFERLRERVGTARKYAPAARDYVLFRTLYLAGLRAHEAVMLDVTDLHFARGPFGKVHVRFGKGARTSGPRPRWVPMLDHLDVMLRWFLDDVRPLFGDDEALFCQQSGGRITVSTLRNRLAALWGQFGDEVSYFSPHDLRRACATRNYERGVDLVAIQQMLGHWHIGTTMRYVLPSATFIEDAYRRAVSDTVGVLNADEGATR